MQEAFTRQRLIGHLDVLNPGFDHAMDRWEPQPRFGMYPAVTKMLLDLATEVFIGVESGPEADQIGHAFVDCVLAAKSIVRADIPLSTWHRGVVARGVLEDYLRERIPAARAAQRSDLLSVLGRTCSDEGAQFSDDDIVNHMIFVLMAAHDTSTVALTMMTYLLGRHQDWQDRVRAESVALGKPMINYDDLDRLPALDLVFKETLRMFSSVGLIARRAVADTQIQGHYVPEGTMIVLGPYPTMRTQPWWSKPRHVRPRTVRRTPPRGQDPPDGLDAVRRRRTAGNQGNALIERLSYDVARGS